MYPQRKRSLNPERGMLRQLLGAMAIITMLCRFAYADGDVTATREVLLGTNKPELNPSTATIGSSIYLRRDDSQFNSPRIGCSQPYCQQNSVAKPYGYRRRRDITSRTCGGTFNGSGRFQSTNFPGNYLDNLHCTWTLQAAPEHEAMVLQIIHFSTESCCDHFRITDNLGFQLSLSGMRQPHNITLGRRATINFTTDSSITSSGFKIAFSSLKKASGSCEYGWTFKGQSCYKLTPERLTWSDAQEKCRTMNSLLVEVENAEDQEALNGFLNSQEPPVWSAWIGLSDLVRYRFWIWGSGQLMRYSKWMVSEPNNLGGAERCVNVWPNISSSWNDYACSATFPGVCQKVHCGSGWTSTRKSCYQLTDEATRDEAQSKCHSINGSLVEIENSVQQEELQDFLRSQGVNVDDTWIGLSDPQKNRVWKWDSGSDSTYSNWIADEPNNAGGEEYCVNVWREYNFGWNDVACNHNFSGVCKQNKDRSSTPALASIMGSLFASSAQSTTTPGATFTLTDAPGCGMSSELCHKLSQRGLCHEELFKSYMELQCRRSCGLCS